MILYDLVGGLVAMNFIFPYIGLGISSSQLTFIFFRGVAQPPTSDVVICNVGKADQTFQFPQVITMFAAGNP